MTPEQQARVEIDRLLDAAGWSVQDATLPNLFARRGVAIREQSMSGGFADCHSILTSFVPLPPLPSPYLPLTDHASHFTLFHPFFTPIPFTEHPFCLIIPS
jgi:hypothetical protein